MDVALEHTLDLPVDPGASAPRGFVIGASINHFRIIRELGAGGMGIVFEAYDPDLDRRVALKILRDRQGHRLIAEAQAMARLAHPNVVAVHEVGTVGDQLFVVMELVDGDTLASWLAEPRTWREIVEMFVQAGNGLVAAHEAGLVHGDFKPNNVLVDRAGRARVADFGLARCDDADDRAPALAAGSRPAGTPGYMAPEQVAGGELDGRTDQYAFAVALREALPDRGPPRRIRRAIERALAPDREQRFPIMRDLLAALRPTHRRAVVAALGLATVSAAVAGVLVASTATPALDDCADGAALVDHVWSADARTRMTSEPATRAVDDWASAWRLGRRTACSAEPAQRPAQLACLDGRLADLRAQLAVWERTGQDRAFGAAATLPSPDACATAPAAPQASAWLIVQRTAMIGALRRAGRSADAQPLLAALLADADAAGDPGAHAGALFAAGSIERDLGAHGRAGEHFAAAAREARRAGDDNRILDAMILQAASANDHGKPLESLGILDAAAGFGGKKAGTTVLDAQLAAARSDALASAGRLPEAVVEAKRAIAILEPLAQREPAARVRLAAALGSLAAAQSLGFHHVEARALLLRCLAMEEADYGFDHPEIAKTLHDLANTESRLGEFTEALAHYDRARAILVKAYGEHHHLVALSDYSVGNLELLRERPADARPHFDRALAGLLASVGPDHVDVSRLEGAIGYLERAADRCREAIPHLERGRAVLERTGRAGSEISIILTNLGACLADVGRDAEARPVLERALAEIVKAGMPEIERSEVNALLAEIEWRAGHRAQAITLANVVIAATAGRDEPYATLNRYMTAELAQWLGKPSKP